MINLSYVSDRFAFEEYLKAVLRHSSIEPIKHIGVHLIKRIGNLMHSFGKTEQCYADNVVHGSIFHATSERVA